MQTTIERDYLHQAVNRLSDQRLVELTSFINFLLFKDQQQSDSTVSVNWTDTDLRLYSALMLFQLKKLSSGAAAQMAGVSRVAFFDLCATYKIPISQISPDDLAKEVIDADVD